MESGGRRRSGRQMQAFQDLMDPAFLDEDLLGSSGGSRKGNAAADRRREKGGSGGKLRGFRLRSEIPPEPAADGRAERDAALQQLAASFSADMGLVIEVHSSTGGSLETTIAALQQMGFGPSEGRAGPSQPTASGSEIPSAAAGTGGEPAAAAGPDWWAALPEDLKLAVWQRLGARDIARAAAVSREFAVRARGSRARRTELVIPSGLTRQALTGMIAAHPAARRLSLRRCLPELRHAVHWQDFFAAVAAAGRRRAARGAAPVSALDLRNAETLEDGDAAELLQTLGSLQDLSLAGCERLGPATLQRLARYSAWELAEEVPTAEDGELAAAEPPQGADGEQPAAGGTARQAVARAWAEREAAAEAAEAAAAERPQGPGLRRLDLSACTKLNAASLRALLCTGRTAASLRELAVSHSPAVEDALLDSLARSSLRCLRAQHCSGLRRADISLPASHPLEELHLAGCSLDAFAAAAPGLRRLSLGHCRRLERLSLRGAQQLRQLHAPLCPRLAALEAVGGLPRLQQLNLNGCASLLSSELQPLLTDTPELASLDLNGCVRLGELSLAAQPQLLSVDVTGCRALRRLDCGSPALRQLHAVGCTRLLEVSLLSKTLEALDLRNCGELAALLLGGEGGGGIAGRLRYCIAGCPRLGEASLAMLRALGRPSRRLERVG